jgi:hypothetical protein
MLSHFKRPIQSRLLAILYGNNLVNTITFSLAQIDYIKRFLLYKILILISQRGEMLKR